MLQAHERFLKHLRTEGLKMTAERAAIVNTFLESRKHMTAEELHGMVKSSNGNIGLSTVYRTLKLLVESGVAEAFDAGDGVVVYERDDGRGHHDHIICESCGVKVEIVDPVIEDRQIRLAEEQGFTLNRHLMLLYGLCPDCRERTKK